MKKPSNLDQGKEKKNRDWWREIEIDEGRKSLFKKRLGQNKLLCNSSQVELPVVKLSLQAPQRSLRQGDRSLATYRLLALKPHWLRLSFIAFFLLPHFGASSSVSCWSLLLSLQGELSHWLGYGWSGINGRRSCC